MRCRRGKRSAGDAADFVLHDLAGERQAMAALGAAAKTLIGLLFATDAAARDLADLGFPKSIAGTDDHAESLPPVVVATHMQERALMQAFRSSAPC